MHTATNALPGADAIAVPAGTYVLNLASGSPPTYTGSLDIVDSVTIAGVGAGATFVDGAADANMLHSAFTVAGLCLGVPSPTVEIKSLTIRRGVGFPGGGVLNRGNLTLANVIVRDNSAPDLRGGGVANECGELRMTNSLVANNSSQTGGGISNRGTMTLTNVTVSGNRAGYDAAGITSSGTSRIVSSTISNNAANGISPFLGGTAGTIELSNSVVTGNIGASCGGPISSLGHNISSDATCGLTGPGDMNGVDPKLGPLADNGGPTQTHALLAGSPAINAGDNNGCPATDQRGVARPQQGVCDIGSYEYQPPSPPPPAPPPPAVVQPTPAATPAPTPEPTASASPTRSARKTSLHTRTPTPTAVEASVDNSGGGRSAAVVIGATLGVVAFGAAGAGGAYYWYRRRGRGAV